VLSQTKSHTLLLRALIVLGFASGVSVQAVVPYSQATVSRLYKKVSYGDTANRAIRDAKVTDVVKAATYLLTETDARAELKYDDGSIVRIGQNTVFTFEADTRSLSLEKGSLVFYIPKGSGGGTVRTASITAAITGTIGKVTENLIAILEGEVTLIPSGRKVAAGFFAKAEPDGTISILPFDVDKALGGSLLTFGGPLPTLDEDKLRALALAYRPKPEFLPEIPSFLETLDRTQNHPGAKDIFNPPDIIRPPQRPPVPPPTNTPNGPGRPPGQY
jgi:FecR protein